MPAIGLWTSAAAGKVDRPAARWTLEYDPQLRLVSFEVWAGGVCVYGADDLAQ